MSFISVSSHFPAPLFTDFISRELGHLGHSSVQAINDLKARLQGSASAGSVVVLSNLLFVQIALKVCQISYQIFNRFPVSQEERSRFGTTGLMSLFILTLTGLNMALVRGLQLPLSSLTVVALSTSTVGGFLFYNYMRDHLAPDLAVIV